MMKTLSSKKYSFGNKDYWWYNLSSPKDWMTRNSRITLILNDENNDKIGSILLKLNMNDWYDRIIIATNHVWHGREIIKIHVTKENGSQQYNIYFGKMGDGVYPVSLERE